MPSDQKAREDRLTAAGQEFSDALEDVMWRTGNRSQDIDAINRLIHAVIRQAHAIMTVFPLSGVEAGVRDVVAGQIYHDPGDSNPCRRCNGSAIDPYFSQPAQGPSYNSMGEPPVLEPCVACQHGPGKPAGPAEVFPARVRMNNNFHAAQLWPDGVNVEPGAPLTACRMTVYRPSWYVGDDTVVTCGPCRDVLGL